MESTRIIKKHFDLDEINASSIADDSLSLLNLASICVSNDDGKNISSFWDVSIQELDDQIRSKEKLCFKKEFDRRSFENLIAILISVVRKQFNEDPDIREFLTQLSYFVILPKYSIFFEKYNDETIQKNFHSIRTKSKSQDLFGFYYFRQNFYTLLVGFDAKNNVNQIRFDKAIKSMNEKYLDYLILKHKIDQIRLSNLKSVENIKKLYHHCFNSKLQSVIKLLFLEKFTQIELLLKKFEKKKNLEILAAAISSANKQNNDNFHNQYRSLVIENNSLKERLMKLRNLKHQVETFNQIKVEKIRYLIKNIQFVETLNQSPIVNSDHSSLLSPITDSPRSDQTISQRRYSSPSIENLELTQSSSSFKRLSLSFENEYSVRI